LAPPSRPSAAKRQKERARQEKQKEKAERRAQRLADKGKRPEGDAAGEDPDIAGIVPGPQPLPPEFGEE
jgi:hypothetical protein